MVNMSERVTAGTTITIFEDQKIQKIVESGKYLDKADFIRQAIREKLQHESL